MKPITHAFVSLGLAIAFAATPAVAADSGLKPFTATYDASYMGMHTTGTMTLAPSGGDRWTYSFRIDSPIAKLEQVTVFEADGGTWKPLSNSDSSTFLIKKSSKRATYDWNAGEARWSGDVKDDRKGPVSLKPGDLDAMLLNMAIARDVAAGKPLEYRMVDDGKVRRMTYRKIGTDTVSIGGQEYQATRVSRKEGNKEQLLWVVDGLPVPTRILQREDGKDAMDLTLTSIR
jgi:hypothetical protein